MLEPEVRAQLDDLSAADDRVRLAALESVLRLTQDVVPWADDVWDELALKLKEPNSYQRSIGLMVLCNLAKSVSVERVSGTLPLLMERTRDDKFITSRQCLQSLWKVAAAHHSLTGTVLDHLEARFRDCADEAHGNLLRRDVIQSMRSLYDATHDPVVWDRAHRLVQEEPSLRFRKQYEKVLGAPWPAA